MKNAFLISALALSVSATSVAAEGFYAGAALTALTAGDDDFEVETTNITATLGYEVNQTFAVEGEFSFPLKEDDISGVDFGLTTSALYAKASFPIAPGFSAHGRLGFMNLDVEASANGATASTDESGAVFGVGGEYAIAPNAAIRGDATFGDIDGADITALSLGAVFSF